MKKVLCIILTTIVLINSTLIINADSFFDPIKDKIEVVLGVAVYSDAEYRIQQADLTDLYYGDIIEAYSVIDGELTVSPGTFIPIYSDGEMYGVVERFPDNNGGYNYSYEEHYAQELASFLEDYQSVTIVGDYHGMIVYSGNDSMELTGEFSSDSMEVLEEASNAINYTQVSHTNVLFNTRSIQQMRADDLTVTISNSINVPYRTQYNDFSCWAACIAAVGMYEGCGSYSALQVCDMMSNHGANSISGTRYALYEIFGIAANEEYSEPSKATIVSLINADEPIISFFSKNNGTTGHAVVGKGYTLNNNNFTYKYMDPWYGSDKFVTVNMSSGLSISINYYGNTILYNHFDGYLDLI